MAGSSGGHGSGGGNSASAGAGGHGSGGGNSPGSSSGPSYTTGPSSTGASQPTTNEILIELENKRKAEAAERAANAQKQAEEFARTQAGIASQAAARESSGYARSQGLNPAQAALLSSQTAGNTYGSAYGSGLFSKLGLDMQKYGIDRNYQIQRDQMEQQNTNNMFGAIGAGLSSAALLFSDEDVKTDIKDGYGILERVTKVVSPKTFKVKPEAGGTGDTDVGIIAQDLEKTPLASTVVDTPEGKMVDTRKLTTANTGMLTELSKKVDTLYSFLKEAGYGPARAS